MSRSWQQASTWSTPAHRIEDWVVNDLSPKYRDIAMVFQSDALYPT